MNQYITFPTWICTNIRSPNNKQAFNPREDACTTFQGNGTPVCGNCDFYRKKEDQTN